MFSKNYFSPNNLSLIFFPSSNLFLACYLSSSSLGRSTFGVLQHFFSPFIFFLILILTRVLVLIFELWWFFGIHLFRSWLTLVIFALFHIVIIVYRLIVLGLFGPKKLKYICTLCSASIYSFFRAFLSFYSMALLAHNWSNSDYLSLAFSYISLNLYNSFSFSSLIRLKNIFYK